jgi:hypothetical protein
MRRRLLIRALRVGVALLVPVGGLTVLGVDTAGATTTIQTVATSTATLGTIGTATMVGISCSITISGGTKQCHLTNQQFKISKTGSDIATLLVSGTLLFTIVTTSGTKSFKKIGFKKTTIKAGIKSTVTPGINDCAIAGLPAIEYSKTGSSGLKWSSKTNSLAGTSVTGCANATRDVTVEGQLHGSKLNGILTFNQI